MHDPDVASGWTLGTVRFRAGRLPAPQRGRRFQHAEPYGALNPAENDQ